MLGLARRRSSGRAADVEALGELLQAQLRALVRHDGPPQTPTAVTEVSA